MSDRSGLRTTCCARPTVQRHRICPTNPFVEFKREEVEQSISDRFEQQVRMYPHRIAIKTRRCELTYGALNEAANRGGRAILAHAEAGAQTVALLLEKDAPLAALMLGVLKAGKLFTVLDSSFPRARIASMLEDSQAALLVADDQNLSLAMELARNEIHILNFDEIDSSLSTENLGRTISSENPASIVYTSGSTGTPKGVVLSHRNVLHRAMGQINNFHISADDRLTHLASFSTAQGLANIFCALLNGASLYPLNVREEGLTYLAAWLIEEEITFYNSSASVFRYFIDTLTGEEEFPHLRLVRLASEQVMWKDVELFRKHFPPTCLMANTLSTTETGTLRLYFIDKETSPNGTDVPAGNAVEDMEVLLLDETGAEVGLGEIGEITVKSRYLSPGYWRRPDLTSAAFQSDPQGGDERVYRTGDLGRMLPSNLLVHAGRKDFQVKIRGHRVEVLEIEQTLLEHASVKKAVVAARKNARGDKILTAYLVLAPKTPKLILSKLRRSLLKKLPDYMVPSAFVILAELPLTSNGKVDRRALPVPDLSRPEGERAFVAPRTSAEEELTKIWSEVLGVAQVGVYDNFFELGGHSLLATQVVSRVRNALQVELTLRNMFEAPTVGGLAESIENIRQVREPVLNAPTARISLDNFDEGRI